MQTSDSCIGAYTRPSLLSNPHIAQLLTVDSSSFQGYARKTGGSSNDVNEVILFKAPEVQVDRVTIKPPVKLEGSCGVTDFRSVRVMCVTSLDVVNKPPLVPYVLFAVLVVLLSLGPAHSRCWFYFAE
jgi:hypothetical protein